MVMWSGNLWYNRIGCAIARFLQLDGDLCTSARPKFVEKIVELATNNSYYEQVRLKIQQANLTTLYDSRIRIPVVSGQNDDIVEMRESDVFASAVEYLVNNHQTLRKESRTPGPGRPPSIDLDNEWRKGWQRRNVTDNGKKASRRRRSSDRTKTKGEL